MCSIARMDPKQLKGLDPPKSLSLNHSELRLHSGCNDLHSGCNLAALRLQSRCTKAEIIIFYFIM